MKFSRVGAVSNRPELFRAHLWAVKCKTHSHCFFICSRWMRYEKSLCRYPANRVPTYTGQRLSTALNKAPRSLTKKGFSPSCGPTDLASPPTRGSGQCRHVSHKERAQSHSQFWSTACGPDCTPGSIWKTRPVPTRSGLKLGRVTTPGREPSQPSSGRSGAATCHPPSEEAADYGGCPPPRQPGPGPPRVPRAHGGASSCRPHPPTAFIAGRRACPNIH